MGSARAAELAARLREAGAAAIAVVERIEPAQWGHVPAPGAWSVGKEAEHIAEGAAYHQWIVRLSLGEKVSSKRPKLERAELTTRLTPAEMAALIRQRAEEGAALVGGLTDAQLALPTKPPRSPPMTVAAAIERILIGHVDGHRAEIEARLR
jgi:hypothetical protein